IPSPKEMDLYRVLVAELAQTPEAPVDVSAVARRNAVPAGQLLKEAEGPVKRGVLRRSASGPPVFDPVVNAKQSWAYTGEFCQNVCARLFLEKDPRALQYNAPDEYGVVRRRWMAPEDIGFLIGVGMRLLSEACWKRNILFYGVVADSMSRYLTRNFLGVS